MSAASPSVVVKRLVTHRVIVRRVVQPAPMPRFSGPAAAAPRPAGKVRANAPAPDSSAIPWLLLDATAKTVPGVLAQVVVIQRLATVGGALDDPSCTQAQLGAQRRMPYTAAYRYYAPTK